MSSKKATALAVLLVVSAVAYLLACSQATWSPDGKHLAFVSEAGGKAQFHLYVASTDGGKVRELWHTDALLGAPVWSPDGKTLAVVGTEVVSPTVGEEAKDLPKGKGAEEAVLAHRLHLIDVATGKQRVLVEQKFVGDPDLAKANERRILEPFPQWALDGKALLWPLVGLRQARLVDARDGKTIRTWEAVVLCPVVSPSGKLAAFYRDPEGESEMSLVVLDLEKVRPLATHSLEKEKIGFEAAGLLAWSPDSSQLAICGECDKADGKSHGIWILDIKSGNPRQILKGFQPMPVWIDWSPKGDRLAMGALLEDKKEGGDQGKGGVWLLKPDGSDLKRLDQPKDPKDMAYHPTFSPDGGRVCWRVMNNTNPAVQVVVYDIAKGTRTPVTLKLPKPAAPDKTKEGASKPVGASDQKEAKEKTAP